MFKRMNADDWEKAEDCCLDRFSEIVHKLRVAIREFEHGMLRNFIALFMMSSPLSLSPRLAVFTGSAGRRGVY
jgi:hypothetical protein